MIMKSTDGPSPRVILESKIAGHDPMLYSSPEVAPRVDGFSAVGSGEVLDYEREGFLVIRAGLTPAEVTAAKSELEQMTLSDDPDCSEIYYEGVIRDLLPVPEGPLSGEAQPTTRNLAFGTPADRLPAIDRQVRARLVRKFMGFVRQHLPLAATAHKPELVALVERLVGEPVRLFQDMAIIKPAGGREKPWHQDHAYFNFPLETRIVGVWIALGQVTPENGCMFVLAGGHHEGPLLHFRRRDWQICDAEVLPRKQLAVPMDPGDVLIFDAKLPHGTPTNRTQEQRWALQYHYVPARAIQVGDDVRLAAFGSEGKNVTC